MPDRRGLLGSPPSPYRRRRSAMRKRRALLVVGCVALVSVYTVLHLTLRPAASKGSISQRNRWFGPGGLTWKEYSAIRAAERRQGLGDTSSSSSASSSSSSSSGSSLPSMEEYMKRAKAGPHPFHLKYPILWCGALFSKSGYGTEAISYVSSLLQLGLVAHEDVWVGQAGDHVHPDLVASMEPGLRTLLYNHHYRNMTQTLPPDKASRPLISVCHTFPDCWRLPADDDTRVTLKKVLRAIGHFFKHTVARIKYDDSGCPCPYADIKDQVVYHVGRSMFETESLPEPLVPYAGTVDEVWVPSEFNRHTFASAGVSMDKLFTLYEGINTTHFDAATQPALGLADMGGVMVAGRPPPDTQQQQQQQAAAAGAAVHARHLMRAPTLHTTAPGEQSKLKRARRKHARNSQTTLAAHGTTADHRQLQAGRGGVASAAAAESTAAAADAAARGSGSAAAAAAGTQAVQHDGPYRFLSVFKWEMRKGWDMLLRAYTQEFKGDPHVELHIVTKPAFKKVTDWPSFFREEVAPVLNISDPRDEQQWAALPRIILHAHHIPDSHYPGLYAAMDALVIPTHGEGWGRPQIEAMAMGLPVITTNWSGLTAFINDQVAYPIRVARIVDITGEDFDMFKGQRWALPDEDHVKQLMRTVYTQRSAAVAKGLAGRDHIRQHFSELAVAQQLVALILRAQDVVDDLLWGGTTTAQLTGGTQAHVASQSPPGAGVPVAWQGQQQKHHRHHHRVTDAAGVGIGGGGGSQHSAIAAGEHQARKHPHGHHHGKRRPHHRQRGVHAGAGVGAAEAEGAAGAADWN